MRGIQTAQHANPAGCNEWSELWDPTRKRTRKHPIPKQGPREDRAAATAMAGDATGTVADAIDG